MLCDTLRRIHGKTACQRTLTGCQRNSGHQRVVQHRPLDAGRAHQLFRRALSRTPPLFLPAPPQPPGGGGGGGLQLHRWPARHAGPCRAARPANAGILDRPAACRDGSPGLRCLAGPPPQQACLHPHSHLRPVSSAAGSLADIRAAARQSPRTIGQVVGYPGDHLGVSLSLTSPASTLYGSAAWRLPPTFWMISRSASASQRRSQHILPHTHSEMQSLGAAAGWT